MRRRAVRSVVLLGAVLSLGVAAAGPAAAATPPVTVDMTQSTMSTTIGHKFGLDSVVRNSAAQQATGLVAHLNIVSLDPSVYVDPEDWSGERTRYLEPVAAGGNSHLHWKLQAVNDGRFVVYVALYDRGDGSLVATARPVRLNVAAQSTLNAGGVLPVALGLPVGLFLLLVLSVVRRRRLS